MPFDEQEDELEGCLMWLCATVLGVIIIAAAVAALVVWL